MNFNLSSWCLVMVERLILAVPRGCLQFVIVVFPDHTHLLFFINFNENRRNDEQFQKNKGCALKKILTSQLLSAL